MENLLIHGGLPSLFILSFLAATVLPLGSEWLLVVLILGGDHSTTNLIIVATTGNYCGACSTYLIGIWSSTFFTRKILHIDPSALNRAKEIYSRYGHWSLLLSWMPIIGDPLCLVGGIFRLHFGLFSILVLLGKAARYSALGAVTIMAQA